MRRIAVITGTRAEYGLLESVLDAIDAHRGLKLLLVVTGTHLTTDSIRDIQRPIAARVPMHKKGSGVVSKGGRRGPKTTPDPFSPSEKAKKVSDTIMRAKKVPNPFSRADDVQALGRGMAGMGRALDKLSPAVVLVLGDRVEALAGALAGQVGGHRVAHIHGGDRAEGVADEAMRHAISKLAHLHFAASAQSRRRLVRMGEVAERVYNTGSPAIDALRGVVPAEDAPDVIVMQHPIGASDGDEYKWMMATLKATANHRRLVMSPNHDPGRTGIVRAIADHGVTPTDHLPRAAFLALLAGARVLVGNSSAGLIEAAALRTACVNLGPRQAGRERPRSVIDGDYGVASTRRALRDALALNTTKIRHPYGDGHAGQRIARLLASIDLDDVPLRKRNAY
ncbi:MAG: UDP-N-acetylglucosamine 2-epimerase [Phycisphaeraceae bacterium]